MDLDKLQSKLCLAARYRIPDESVPYGFEKRVMARVCGLAIQQSGAIWEQVLWKAAVACAAVSILLGAWSMQAALETKPVSLEAAVFSMANQLGETW